MDLSFLFVAAFAGTLLASILLIRWLRARAPRWGLVDWPGEDRRVHTRPTAVVGGMGIALTLALVGAVLMLGTDLPERHPQQIAALAPVVLGALAMHLVGVWDDINHLPSTVKAGFQVLIAFTVFVGGIQLTSVEVPLLGVVHFSDTVALGVTVFWLVGITNAFNLVDGSDGLAGGAALMATGAMFVVALALGHELIALFLAVVGAATLGFLHYNFPPASVFLGDSGSLFLGFLLAGLGVVSSTKTATVVAIAVPVVAFGLPVVDTSLAIVRRLLRGDSISKADRGHIHHRLIDLGHSPRTVAIILYAVCGAFATASLVTLSSERLVVGPVFAIVAVATWFGIERLRVPELLELRKMLGRETGLRRKIGRNVEIRNHARRMRHAESVDRVLDELARALDQTEFRDVEICLEASRTNGSPQPAGWNPVSGEVEDDGHVWRWCRNGGPPYETPCVEVRVPLMTLDGKRQIGHFLIRREMARTATADGLTVVADELLPAVAGALERVGDTGVVIGSETFDPTTNGSGKLRAASG